VVGYSLRGYVLWITALIGSFYTSSASNLGRFNFRPRFEAKGKVRWKFHLWFGVQLRILALTYRHVVHDFKFDFHFYIFYIDTVFIYFIHLEGTAAPYRRGGAWSPVAWVYLDGGPADLQGGPRFWSSHLVGGGAERMRGQHFRTGGPVPVPPPWRYGAVPLLKCWPPCSRLFSWFSAFKKKYGAPPANQLAHPLNEPTLRGWGTDCSLKWKLLTFTWKVAGFIDK